MMHRDGHGCQEGGWGARCGCRHTAVVPPAGSTTARRAGHEPYFGATNGKTIKDKLIAIRTKLLHCINVNRFVVATLGRRHGRCGHGVNDQKERNMSKRLAVDDAGWQHVFGGSFACEVFFRPRKELRKGVLFF